MAIVVSDFFEDVRRDSVAALVRHGVTPPPGADAHLAAIECFHLQRRLIRPLPRRILWSTQLRARDVTGDQRRRVENIAAELERGDDVTPRMTKFIRRPSFNDGLLTDWGIHHLHLGDVTGTGSFVERGGPLLFVFVKDGTAHLVDLLDHDAFEDDDLIEIIHASWPDAIRSWRAPGAIPGSATVFSSESRKKLRRKFLIPTQTKDGTIYLPPGGGVVTSGHSAEAVREANALLNLVHPADQWVREHADLIADRIAQLTRTRPDELHLQFMTVLTLVNRRAVVWEKLTRAEILPGGPEPIVGVLGRAS